MFIIEHNLQSGIFLHFNFFAEERVIGEARLLISFIMSCQMSQIKIF